MAGEEDVRRHASVTKPPRTIADYMAAVDVPGEIAAVGVLPVLMHEFGIKIVRDIDGLLWQVADICPMSLSPLGGPGEQSVREAIQYERWLDRAARRRSHKLAQRSSEPWNMSANTSATWRRRRLGRGRVAS